MTLALLVALAGATGGTLRYLVDHAVAHLIPESHRSLPWATLLINVSGSFALGLVAFATTAALINPETGLVLGIGLCGGYTTFSTAMVETANLIGQQHLGRAVLYWTGGLLLTVAAAAGGWALLA